MPDSIDTGALLSRSYALPAGPRVRLRLARRSDLPALRALLEARGIEPSELTLSRLVHYDPWTRVVICATAPLGGTETIVGVGAIDLCSDPARHARRRRAADRRARPAAAFRAPAACRCSRAPGRLNGRLT